VATLSDVAQSVGVSITAASLVLSDSPGASRISEATAQRIRETAERLGYYPNVAARRLASSRTDLVGVLADTFFYSISLRRLEATTRALLKGGYQPLVWAADWSPDGWTQAHSILASNSAAGAVLLGPTYPVPTTEIARGLTGAGIPTVSFDAGDGLPGAGVDRLGAFYELTRAAIGAGHTKIGYLQPGQVTQPDVLRMAGIEAAVSECPHVTLVTFHPFPADAPPAREHSRDLGFETGRLGAHRYLEDDHPPSAIICYSDDVAISFMHTVQSAGVKVPEDVAVFGFDGLPESSCSYPPLTTIEQPVDAVGAAAVGSLLSLINVPDTASEEYRLLPGRLIARESTGTLPRFPQDGDGPVDPKPHDG